MFVALRWQYLSVCVAGATLQAAEDEEEEVAEDDDEEKEPDDSKAGAYEVVGTLSDPASPKPDFVKEIVKVDNKYCMLNIGFYCYINA